LIFKTPSAFQLPTAASVGGFDITVTSPKDNDLAGSRVMRFKARIGALYDKNIYVRFNVVVD